MEFKAVRWALAGQTRTVALARVPLYRSTVGPGPGPVSSLGGCGRAGSARVCMKQLERGAQVADNSRPTTMAGQWRPRADVDCATATTVTVQCRDNSDQPAQSHAMTARAWALGWVVGHDP